MPLPKKVSFSHDLECNARCIICRRSLITNTKERTAKLNAKIDTLFLPMLKNAKLVMMNGSGEALASRHGRELIRRIAEAYPSIRFIIETNGLIANERTLEGLGIADRVYDIELSLHAASKETYDKIVLGSDWRRVMANLDELIRMKAEGRINYIGVNFVAFALNYREIPDFIRLAKQKGIDSAKIWGWRLEGKDGPTHTQKQFKRLDIASEKSPYWRDLVRVLHDPICRDEIVSFSPPFIRAMAEPVRRPSILDRILMARPLDYMPIQDPPFK